MELLLINLVDIFCLFQIYPENGVEARDDKFREARTTQRLLMNYEQRWRLQSFPFV